MFAAGGGPGPANAMSVPAPSREMSPFELAQYAATSADAVVIARVASMRDTLVSGLWSRFIFLEHARWLKGAAMDSSLHVAIAGYNEDAVAASQSVRRLPYQHPRVLCFLVRGPAHWHLTSSYYGGGIHELENPGAEERIAMVVRAIASCSPESLARRTEVLLIGSVTNYKTACMLDNRRVGCAEVAVESVAFGAVDTSRIHVVGPAGNSLWQDGRILFFLRRLHGSLYEVVGSNAGTLEIGDGYVARRRGAPYLPREPLDAVLTRFHALRARR